MREELLRIFPTRIRKILERLPADDGRLQEVRLRARAPLLLVFQDREAVLTPEGALTADPGAGYRVSQQELKETMEYVSKYSLYAYEEELRQGFITVQGGHRVGVAGKTVVDEHGVRGIKFISSINVRLAHQVKGCADAVMPYVFCQGELCHTLVISPPRCGKTTLLRDIIRQVSDGCLGLPGMSVGVVDERSELGACCQGVPQNDLGIRTDVLDGCPKAQGMMMLIRTMSPQVVAVDEIGSAGELEAMEYAMNCGCRILATIHGTSFQEVQRKPALERLVREQWFGRYIILPPGRMAGGQGHIYDGRGRCLYPPGGGR